MKTTKTIIAIIALAIVATAVAIVSCKKEKQEQTSYTLEQSEQPSENMDAYLLSFKKKLLSAEKGSELLSLEEARLNLGNLLNFDFDDANYATNVFHYDTLHVKLTLTNGQVDLSDLAEAYFEAFEQILDALNAVSITEKSVYGIHCEIENKEKSDNVDVEISLITRGLTEVPLQLDFGESECWRTINGGGRCDTTSTEAYGAIQMIAVIANNRLSINNVSPLCPHGQRVVFDEYNSITYHIDGYSSDHDPLSPVGGQELYTNHHIYDTCLCYDALHYFLEKTIEIGQEHKPSHHIIYHYISFLDGCSVNNSCGWQVLNVFYRRYWCSDEPIQY